MKVGILQNLYFDNFIKHFPCDVLIIVWYVKLTICSPLEPTVWWDYNYAYLFYLPLSMVESFLYLYIGLYLYFHKFVELALNICIDRLF